MLYSLLSCSLYSESNWTCMNLPDWYSSDNLIIIVYILLLRTVFLVLLPASRDLDQFYSKEIGWRDRLLSRTTSGSPKLLCMYVNILDSMGGSFFSDVCWYIDCVSRGCWGLVMTHACGRGAALALPSKLDDQGDLCVLRVCDDSCLWAGVGSSPYLTLGARWPGHYGWTCGNFSSLIKFY